MFFQNNKRFIPLLGMILAISPLLSQTTALDFDRDDCNGVHHHLFAELDAGKVVLLEFYMEGCSTCEPPAKELQIMASHVASRHPGMVQCYAISYENFTSCASVSAWAATNGLHLFSPLDSGATQVAYYGGFGMPTVVLLEGTDHRVAYNTKTYTWADTIALKDSMMNFFGDTDYSALNAETSANKAFHWNSVGQDQYRLQLTNNSHSGDYMEIRDSGGRRIYQTELTTSLQDVSTDNWMNGLYILYVRCENQCYSQKFVIQH